MSDKKKGFLKLVSEIGQKFFDEHKDTAVFCSQDVDEGLFCFLGIDLHPELRNCCLSAQMSDWDIYASCIVTDSDIVMGECRLPQ